MPPVKHTCPNIDKAIRLISSGIKTAEFGLKNSERRTNEYDYFHDIISDIEDVEPILEQLRSDNDALRTWGIEMEKEKESLENYVSELEEKLALSNKTT